MTNLYTGAHKQKTGFNVLFIILSTAFIQFWVLFTRVLSTYKLELVYSALFVSASGFLYARLHLSHHSASFSSEMKSWLELMRCLGATDESHSSICQPIRQCIYSLSNLSVIQNFELNQLVHWKRLISEVSEQTFFQYRICSHCPYSVANFVWDWWRQFKNIRNRLWLPFSNLYLDRHNFKANQLGIKFLVHKVHF